MDQSIPTILNMLFDKRITESEAIEMLKKVLYSDYGVVGKIEVEEENNEL